MSDFIVTALPADSLERIRRAGVDDFGNPLAIHVNADEDGAPLRCCLREARVGERVALLAWQPSPQPGPYAEVGPVFIHADACPGYAGSGYPSDFRHRQQIFRAYNQRGWVVDNRLVDGSEAEQELASLFAQPSISFVHSRNPLQGCYMFSVSR